MEPYLKHLLPSIDAYMDRMRDQHQERYDGKLDLWTNLPGDRAPAKWLFERVPEGSHHVLDIGTGRGKDLELFLEAGHRATGLDLFELDSWPEMRERWGDKINLSAQRFLTYNPPEKFTIALSVGAFHHQHPDEYAPFLAHVREVLAPGGLFMLCVFHLKNERGPGMIVFKDDRFWRFFTTQELRNVLEDAGFKWVDSSSNHQSLFPYLWALVTH